MLRVLRNIPSLQRKLVYVALASSLVFLLYLLSTSTDEKLADKKHLSHLTQREVDKLQQKLVVPGKHETIEEKPVKQTTQALTQPAEKQPEKQPSKQHGEKLTDTGPDKQPGTLPEEQYRSPPKKQEDKEPYNLPGIQPGHKEEETIKEMEDKNKDREQKEIEKEGSVVQPATPAQADKAVPPPLRFTGDPYSGPRNERQRAVVDAFMHAWSAYKKYAWGHDELKPNTHGWQEWMGVGLTIVDSLSTMWIMGLKNEFKASRDWVANSLTFDRDTDVQVFEIVIRELGGLLSAYHFSKDKAFLDKAKELGTRLMPCFDGSTAVPCRFINLKHGLTRFQENSLAEIGTLQLEFKDLSRSTNDSQYERAVSAVSEHIHRLPKMDGLVANFINAHTGQFRATSTVSAGASADSYYEYLLKQWLQTGKTQSWLKDDYLEAIEGIKKHLLKHSEPSKLAFVGTLYSMGSKSFRSEMEHLACFLPGALALGCMSGLCSDSHLQLAKDLGYTCHEMYRRMPTGLSPEVVAMNLSPTAKEDMYVNYGVQYNLQRPEAIESFFYLYRATKDPKYREWGWEAFQAFEKYTKLKEGYASIDSVKRPDLPGYRDKMETFYLAETLKYLYLLFSDDPDLIPLDKFVINTEAHPLPIYPR